MSLRAVPENHKLAEDGLWDRIRAEVVKLLDQRGIRLSPVDQEDEEDEHSDEEDEEDKGDEEDINDNDIAPVMDGTVYTTPATIWVGVMPDSTTSEQAYILLRVFSTYFSSTTLLTSTSPTASRRSSS
ncbi:hypothetical protein BDN72DRAFT_895701 [Pluteus cervinus]|uniref:Uncharacterized protein n=1 Tax=Pluteus cervinus TaxID=181527 RepID=A0ACD3B186_9AGAR|nr:hypothetical protein BDN72DRAFT_895701 [Pluteus cervinus]